MRHVKRPFGRVVLAALAIVAGSSAVADSAALAADDGIPRPPGAIDNRGYELVSQPDKNANQLLTGGVLASVDGDRVIYQVLGGVPGASSGRPLQIATRGVGGWASRSMLPAYGQLYGTSYQPALSSPDLRQLLIHAHDGLGGNYSGTADLVRLADNGSQALLHSFLMPDVNGFIEAVASADFNRVYLRTSEVIDGSHQLGTENIYDFGQSPPKLVSVRPGAGVAFTCGVVSAGSNPGFVDSNASVRRHWASSDGRRVYFVSRGDVCSGRFNLYMHDVDTEETTLVSGPPVLDIDRGVNPFVGATPDGRYAFYQSPTTLELVDGSDGSNSDMDIYRYDAETRSNTCVTCAVPNAVIATGQERSAVSEDGSRVYFDSTRAHTAGAVAGAHNIYVVRDGALGLAGIASSAIRLSSDPTRGATMSSDGQFLLFFSNRSEMDAMTGSSNGGFTQLYRYDDDAESVVCVSCPTVGTATASLPLSHLAASNQTVRPKLYAMSEDGQMVFFTSNESLVAADVNDGPDIYEWHAGKHGLITNGVTDYPGLIVPEIYTTTPTGRDVFFYDIAALTPEVQDGMLKVFTARIDGGFATATPAPECNGEQCQGLPSGQPHLRVPGSVTLDGAGNIVTAPPVAFAVRRVTRKMNTRMARAGRMVLPVRVGRPGRVTVVGQARIGKRVRRVVRATTVARSAGMVRMNLRLSRVGLRHLARSGRLRVVLGVRYSEAMAAKRVVINLKAAGDRRGR